GVFRLQPPVIFAGQMTRPMAIRPVGPVEIVAAKLEPEGARAFLGRPLIEATDRRLGRVARRGGCAAPAGGLAAAAAALGAWLEDLLWAAGGRIDPALRAQAAAA